MNVQNRTLFIGDNLNVLRGINSDCVDLIYLDPPFNTKKQYKAPIGSPAEGAKFKDIWTDEDVKYEWHGEIAEQYEDLEQVISAAETIYDKSMKFYLMAMTIRLLEMKRVLKSSGSIYLHCDPTASHYLKLVMDSVFGKQNFQNEVVWQAGSSNSVNNKYGRNHDIILYYIKNEGATWNTQYEPHDPNHIKKNYRNKDARGRYNASDLMGPGPTQSESGKPWRGVDPNAIGKHWSVPRTGKYVEYIEEKFIPNYRQIKGVHDRLDILDEKNLIHWPPNGTIPCLKRYLAGSKGRPLQDVIIGIPHVQRNEKTGYPTQKPLKLLDLIIKASSNKGDIVLDPFCGCATACVSAERLERRWIGIDLSPDAEYLTKLRLQEAVDNSSSLWNPIEDINVRFDTPARTDEPNQPHTMRSISKDNLSDHKHELYGKQEGNCFGCEVHFRYRNLTIDHIVPRSLTGDKADDRIENLQLLCQACNSTKGNRTQAEFIKRLEEQGIRQKQP